MHSIENHEFVKNKAGELALFLDFVSKRDEHEPTFLISRDENTAYLRRGPKDIHRIGKIDPAVAAQLRSLEKLFIVEVKNDQIAHSYEAIAGILEDDGEDGDE